MECLEEKIKQFAHDEGIEIVGLAGPDRLDGPPSLDPTYTMRGAKSIVSFAMPMDVDAIYDFLGKKSPVPHGTDQLVMNQKVFRKATRIAEFIKSQGHGAMAVPTNNTYRRSLDVFSTHPSFSHRFGAIAAGVGAQGWSGNIMTKEYGACVYLSTVVTDAKLKSTKAYHPRYFVDNYCKTCKLCDKTCVSGMFEDREEEYVLLNKELHPRGKRRALDLCNASCFGLHTLSRDKKWTTWGEHWMGKWIDNPPDVTKKKQLRMQMLRKGATTGDSTARYDFIRNLGSKLWPKEMIEKCANQSLAAKSQAERNEAIFGLAKEFGITGLKNDIILTCGQCALVCGPTVQESAKRYKILTEAGLVVPGSNGEMVNVGTYEEAAEMRRKYPHRVPREKMKEDAKKSGLMWHKMYFGIEPKSIIQAFIYKLKMKRALKKIGEERYVD